MVVRGARCDPWGLWRCALIHWALTHETATWGSAHFITWMPTEAWPGLPEPLTLKKLNLIQGPLTCFFWSFQPNLIVSQIRCKAPEIASGPWVKFFFCQPHSTSSETYILKSPSPNCSISHCLHRLIATICRFIFPHCRLLEIIQISYVLFCKNPADMSFLVSLMDFFIWLLEVLKSYIFKSYR